MVGPGLRRNRVLLLGITVLIRWVGTVREAAAARMYARLAAAIAVVDLALPGRLRASLTVPAGSRFSEMESWRRAPTRVSGPGWSWPWTGLAAYSGGPSGLGEGGTAKTRCDCPDAMSLSR